MQDFIITHYMWFKALHIISMITWMAGLFYLPRLFVYHANAEIGSEMSETFKIMERKLLRIIMNPAMIATWIFGLSLLWSNSILLDYWWMHLKLTCVVLMTVFHHVLGRYRKVFLRDENKRPHTFFRKINEVPTVLMIVIVLCAVIKPF